MIGASRTFAALREDRHALLWNGQVRGVKQVADSLKVPVHDQSISRQGDKRLLVSIHDVGPMFAREVAGLRDLLARHIPAHHMAMLVVPDHWNQAPLGENRAFKARLRGWAEQGVEMFVHGWYHRDLAEHGDWLSRFKARHMTAQEGEFLGLSQAVAAQRMADGRMLIEDVTGRPVAGFVAPAWLYGPGAMAALANSGFALAEDHMRVWRPETGETLCRGPVITWASRSRARIASSLAVAALARSGLARWPVLRLAVHPGDIHVPELVRSIDRTVASLSAHRRVGRYGELLGFSEAGGNISRRMADVRGDAGPAATPMPSFSSKMLKS